MEVIKRKISLDDYTSRVQENWGELTVDNFHINLFITQDSDDMGIMTDLPFIERNNTQPNYSILIDKLQSNNQIFNFMVGGEFPPQNSNQHIIRDPEKDLSDYFIEGSSISGFTEDRLDLVKSYDKDNTYKVGFDVTKEVYIDYKSDNIDGVSRVISNNNLNPIIYTEDVDSSDPTIGLETQSTGILFKTFNDTLRSVNNDYGEFTIPLTQMYYHAQGFNITNSSLSASIKEEYLLGVTSTPEVESDVFIDRGRTTILQSHLQLSEITNMGELINYGNGSYKIIK
tara:strand:- start:19403 stop:20257 length:855 start_codon:yes stop_codon:yes gene_type:complete